MDGDPVFRDSFDGQWYFWDEVWANKHGPYPNEDHARGMLCLYCDWLDHPKAEPMTKLESWIIFSSAALILVLGWMIVVAVYRYFTS